MAFRSRLLNGVWVTCIPLRLIVPHLTAHGVRADHRWVVSRILRSLPSGHLYLLLPEDYLRPLSQFGSHNLHFL